MTRTDDRLERWDHCGAYARVEVNALDANDLRVTSRKCRDRFCPTCARERSTRIAASVASKVTGQHHRFVTLTIRHHGEPLRELIDKLLTSFRALRRTPLWRTTVKAGAAFLEIKHSNGWHPHLHLITLGSYMPHAELRMMWLKVTGDSSVVDIRLIRDAAITVKYICKYASKPLDHTVIFDRDALAEAVETLKGRKLLWTFGSWRGWTFDEEVDPKCWITLCSLDALLLLARRGDAQAVLVLSKLRRHLKWVEMDESLNLSKSSGQPP